LATHGLPQQSALVTHEEPAGGGAAQLFALRMHRGIPRASLRQQLAGSLLHQLASGALFGSQQLFSAEHDSVLGLQMLPGSRHACPLSHRPNCCAGDDFEHVTAPFTGGGEPAEPQQSLSVAQSSPVGEHPDGGWQIMSLPDVAVGAHTREQHVPPQLGAPASSVEQTLPFGRHSVPPGAAGTEPQVPSVEPVAFTQLPLQHSKFVAQTSFVCAQNETASEHRPALHSFEQHWSLPVHGLPDVLHKVVSGLHTPPPVPFGTHWPPQHSPLLPHARLSATHSLSEHLPPMQE
jgi:hypothetical protein